MSVCRHTIADRCSCLFSGRQQAAPAIASLLLMVVGAAKLHALGGTDTFLQVNDPLFGVSNHHLLLSLGLLELASATAIILSRLAWLKGLIITWLGMNFLIYRAALAATGVAAQCPCLGHLGSRLGLSITATNAVLLLVTIYLLVTGAFLLASDTAVRALFSLWHRATKHI